MSGILASWVCMNCMAPTLITTKDKKNKVIDKDRCWCCGRLFNKEVQNGSAEQAQRTKD